MAKAGRPILDFSMPACHGSGADTLSRSELRPTYRTILVRIPTPRQFVGKLDTFFGQLLKDFRYAVEIRYAGMLGPLYRDMLASHGVAQVYNHWSFMPGFAEQHQKMEQFIAPFTVMRLLTPLKMSYEAAKKHAEPYTKIVGELPDIRKEAVVLIKDTIGQNRRAYCAGPTTDWKATPR
jgi:hypothetical protein